MIKTVYIVHIGLHDCVYHHMALFSLFARYCYLFLLASQIMIRSIFLYLDRTYAVPNSTLLSIWYVVSA